MSIFTSIVNAILGKANAATTTTTTAPASTQETPTSANSNQPLAAVDVTKTLNDLAAKNPEKLNWQTSIVDLMKLLNLDSSMTARKTLAQELKYTGDTNDSAAMNVFLHKQVMTKLAEHGGKLPTNLAA